MGIESTAYITRERAINRIKEMSELFVAAKLGWRMVRVDDVEEISLEIGEKTFDPDIDIESVVDDWEPIDTSNLENWTDEMLGDYMDNPLFRYSMFSNYLIEEEE